MENIATRNVSRLNLKKTDLLNLAKKENERYVRGFYFILDSNNCRDCLINHLYGYVFHEEKLYMNCDLPKDFPEIPVNSIGAYIQIKSSPGKIIIKQDWSGGYGLYVFRNRDGYFAVSNSFLLLLKHVCEKKKSHLNSDFANYFLTADLCSMSIEETLIEEIDVIENEKYIHIITEEVTPSLLIMDAYSTKDFHQVSIASSKGIGLIDDWHDRWSVLLRSLVHQGKCVQCDVTGGFDSRVALALLLSSSLDLSKVSFTSYTGDAYNEDYKIALLIADKLNIKLNQTNHQEFCENIPLPGRVAFEHSLFAKLGFHKSFYMSDVYRPEPIFHLNGFLGEGLRGYMAESKMEGLYHQGKRNRYITFDNGLSIDKVMSRSYEAVKQKYGHLPYFEDIAFSFVYREARGKNHFGKTRIEKLLGNVVSLPVAVDYDLYRLNIFGDKDKDRMLLFALIYDRYFPDLLKIPFEGGRNIYSETIAKAKAINRNFPWKGSVSKIESNLIYVNGNEANQSALRIQHKLEQLSAGTYSMDLFRNDILKALFIDRFGWEPYSEAELDLKSSGLNSKWQLMAVVHIALVLRLIIDNEQETWEKILYNNGKVNYFSDPVHIQEMKDAHHLSNAMRDLLASRVDIKNYGLDNPVEVTSIDRHHLVDIQYPRWFSDEQGTGCTVEGEHTEMSFHIKCHGDGELVFVLRGLNRRKDNNRLPVKVIYTSVIVNNEEKLTQPITTWHDSPHRLIMPVCNNEELHVRIKWQVYNYNFSELKYVIETLMSHYS